ncbi:MAG: FAD-binding protein, partial [Parvularculaceae bacterium]|nr:FAD-binding protein [Parvularculaceae bacterium]
MTFVSPGSVDVIIVGYGVAGAAAAISAHDAGKRVVILEAGHSGGGNAHYSGGFLSDLPVDLATEHLNALCFGRTPIAVLQAYGEGLHRIESWLSSVGARTKPFHPPAGRFPAPFPSWPHQEAGRLTRYFIVEDETAKPGPALWATLERAVKDRKIEVRFDRRVDGLLTDANNAVTGVRIGETTLEAASVILACGGFEADPCLTDAYLPLGDVRPVGHPLNRGDGVRMA